MASAVSVAAAAEEMERAGVGKQPFAVHASFASRTDYNLLRLLQREVEAAGGVFTGGHVANADTWQPVWGDKCLIADRIVVFFTEEYRKYYTSALEWEHGEIHQWANLFPTPVFFLEQSALDDPNELREWLAKVVFEDRHQLHTEEEKEEFRTANTDMDKYDAWRAFCTSKDNLYDYTKDPNSANSFDNTQSGNIVKPNPPLRAPVQAGDEVGVRRLIEQGEDVLMADSFWMTPLHYASQNGYESIVRLLIELAPTLVNAENKFGKPPLYMATAMGHMGVAAILKDSGATASIESTPELEQALRYAAQDGDDSKLREMLEAKIVDIDAGDPGNQDTALHQAAYWNHPSCVVLLLEHGANPKATSGSYGGKTGRTALDKAKEGKHSDCTALLEAAMDGGTGAMLEVAQELGLKGREEEEDGKEEEEAKQGEACCLVC